VQAGLAQELIYHLCRDGGCGDFTKWTRRNISINALNSRARCKESSYMKMSTSSPRDLNPWGNTQQDQHTTCRLLGHSQINWSKVWKLKVEPKCHSLFGYCSNQNYQRRIESSKEEIDPMCKLCHYRHETHLYMMATCNYARRLWRQVELSYNEQGVSNRD
jgi:hypothetical protein